MRDKLATFVYRAGKLALAALALGCLTSPSLLSAATKSSKLPVVAKWGRFDHALKSSASYLNPLQDVKLTAVFTAPDGQARQVEGFWDGGKTWRVRFSPDQPGRWAFKTTCSDAANKGLQDQAGEFVCTAPTGPTRFNRHGPVRVAGDHRHFEHADGTPFFWVADTVWSGARLSEPKDWEYYAGTRMAQRFTVAQWAVTPGVDSKNQSALTGDPARIGINPDFFKRLDARLDMLSRAGILSAIVPVLELESGKGAATDLPDDQAALLVRYIVARWGADPVAWLLVFEGDTQARKIGRWKKIGQAAYGAGGHAPVVLYPGGTSWVLDEFRDQPWVDAFGYRSVNDTSDDALKLACSGPFGKEWLKEPTLPLVVFASYENSAGPQTKKRFSAADVREAVYWGLLLAPPAGVSYGGEGVVTWKTDSGPSDQNAGGSSAAAGNRKSKDLPNWQKSLFMPAAKQMSHVADFFNSIDFWRLRPQPQFVATQPGNESPRRYIAAAGTESKDLVLTYVPEDRTSEILYDALPASPVVTWLNPRDGQNSPAVAVISGRLCQFPTPDPGDWLLVMKAGK